MKAHFRFGSMSLNYLIDWSQSFSYLLQKSPNWQKMGNELEEIESPRWNDERR